MASTPPSAPSGTQLSSFEAHVLPHLVDVTAGTYGIVRSVVVTSYGVVRCGQTVAVLEPVSPRRGSQDHSFAVSAPVAGLVIRCWAPAGELVGGNWPILTIASSENVIVIARFTPGDLRRMGRGGSAAVRVGGDEGEALPARIISAVEAPDAEAVTGRSIRVVLSISEAPANALWPGTPARVAIDS